MTRFKRRMLFDLTLAVLVLFGVGAWVYFYGTRAALQRAENFQLRRMPVAQLAEQGVYLQFTITSIGNATSTAASISKSIAPPPWPSGVSSLTEAGRSAVFGDPIT